MFPGMNKKAMQQAMQRLGMKQEEIDASEVIIKKNDGNNLIIRNPNVLKVDIMGQKSLQITGNIEEETAISDDDVDTVSEQAKVSKKEARLALEKNDGDLAKAILSLKR